MFSKLTKINIIVPQFNFEFFRFLNQKMERYGIDMV